MFTVVRNFFLDILFPSVCVQCGEIGTAFCQTCLKNIEPVEFQCVGCGDRNKDGKTCAYCRRKGLVLTRVIWASRYEDDLIKDAISAFKYKRRKDLALPLANLASNRLEMLFKTSPIHKNKNFLLLPVPLHSKRERERGYNQAELLAREISKQRGIPIAPHNLLKRIIHTNPQAQTKTRKNRLANVANAFAVNNTYPIQDKIIILVDDITTTGATLNSAAKTLKTAGAKGVWGLVVARG